MFKKKAAPAKPPAKPGEAAAPTTAATAPPGIPELTPSGSNPNITTATSYTYDVELWNGFTAIGDRFDEGMRTAVDIEQFVAERCKVENYHNKKVGKLIEQTNFIEKGTVGTCLQELKAQTERYGTFHGNFSQPADGDIIGAIEVLRKDQQAQRLRLQQTVAALQRDYRKLEERHTSLKSRYMTASETAEHALLAYENASLDPTFPPKNLAKLGADHKKLAKEAEDSDDQHKKMVAEFSTYQPKYVESMKAALAEYQSLEEKRIASLSNVMKKYLWIQETYLTNVTDDLEKFKQIANAVDRSLDLQSFLQEKKTSQQVDPQEQYEPYEPKYEKPTPVAVQPISNFGARQSQPPPSSLPPPASAAPLPPPTSSAPSSSAPMRVLPPGAVPMFGGNPAMSGSSGNLSTGPPTAPPKARGRAMPAAAPATGSVVTRGGPGVRGGIGPSGIRGGRGVGRGQFPPAASSNEEEGNGSSAHPPPIASLPPPAAAAPSVPRGTGGPPRGVGRAGSFSRGAATASNNQARAISPRVGAPTGSGTSAGPGAGAGAGAGGPPNRPPPLNPLASAAKPQTQPAPAPAPAVPSLPPAKNVQRATAMFAFAGADEGELRFSVGDKIIIHAIDNSSGWWNGEMNGVVGMFPGNHVQLDELSGPSSGPRERTATVIYDFTATSADELTLRVGDKVVILGEAEAWYTGRNQRGESGMFPANHVQANS